MPARVRLYLRVYAVGFVDLVVEVMLFIKEVLLCLVVNIEFECDALPMDMVAEGALCRMRFVSVASSGWSVSVSFCTFLCCFAL